VAARVKAPLAAWIGCAAALVLLALVAYGIDAAQRADASLLTRFMARDESFGSLAEVIAHCADPLPLLVLLIGACAIALWRGRPLEAVAAIVVVAGANLTTQVLKVALAHPRYQSVLGPDQLGPVAFPSGHATAATSIAIAYALVVPRQWRLLVAAIGATFVLAVGCSIMVLAWHFPSDVLGGVLVAGGWGFAALAVLRALDRDDRRPGPVRSRSGRAPAPSYRG
jgi:membrane-associated phospholipid phosphatase